MKVRQAVQYAIDRKTMIKTLLNGYGSVANGPIAPALKYYYDPKVDAYAYSPKKVGPIAEGSGMGKGSDGVLVKNGKKFSFTLTVGQNGVLVPSAQLIQSYLKKIGMDVSLNIMEWNSMIQRVIVQRNQDASIAWWIYAPDPDMYPYLASTAASTGNNIPDFKDKHLDSILLKGASIASPAKRRVIYSQMQQYAAKVLPYNFLWYPKEVQVLNKKLQGVPKIGLRDAMNYTNKWYMAK